MSNSKPTLISLTENPEPKADILYLGLVEEVDAIFFIVQDKAVLETLGLYLNISSCPSPSVSKSGSPSWFCLIEKGLLVFVSG